ncbi:hypothetical protein PK35_14635 [Tamlana nanhaiensis]|uniref:Uncharacterized protein n=1 Tax=Neotamlana nanhaiensis TaxID=1382798 RepID=A0A0D7VWY2_9FLAO|nr:hypothetical protein [Tamlana nanhaiensis]KJD31346.1 hypothetical protein PK35_14635 [Tamlana nanhaiensis]
MKVGNNMNETNNIEKIKIELINSCVNYDTKSFIPFLMSKNVLTGMPNKTRFYVFLKYMVNCTKQCSEGQLTFKIEQEKITNNQKNYYLNFYDKIHKYSRLSIEVKETNENIYFNTLPF